MKLLKEDIKKTAPALFAAFIFYAILTFIFGSCCPLRILTGLPCPACGTTRSLIALLRLDIKTALWYQPVMPLLILFFIFFCYKRYCKKQTDKLLFLRLLGIIFIICISVYVYRMYKYYPDTPPLEYTQNNIFSNLGGIFNVR